MKLIYLLSLLLLFESSLLIAQQPCSGIYRTASDFQIRQISIPANCQLCKKVIVISDFFLRPYIYIKKEQGKIKINEDSICAIQDCDGNIYRIFKQKAYLLTGTGKLQIYKYTHNANVKVNTSKGMRFEQKQMTNYYFSVDDTSNIIPLTLTNVRLAILTNKELDRELIYAFPNDRSLIEKQDNRFKINRFLSDISNIQ